MSYETEAGAITVPHALTQELVFEGLNGKTPLVAPEVGVTDIETYFPNSIDGAQPDTEASTLVFDSVVASYPDTDLLGDTFAGENVDTFFGPIVEDAPAPNAWFEPTPTPAAVTKIIGTAHVVSPAPKPFAPPKPEAVSAPEPREPLINLDYEDVPVEWRARVSHRPKAPKGWLVNPKSKSDGYFHPKTPRTPIEGEIVPGTEEGAAVEAAKSNKWADFKAYVGVKLRPELWSTRARTVTVLGGMVMTVAGVALTVYGAKHGAHISFIDGSPDTNSPDAGTTPADMPVPEGHSPIEADRPHVPTPTEAPAPEQPAEHFRTAVGYDQETDRASNVHDWSVDSLRDAGKDANLTDSQIDKLVHDHKNVDYINDAFYDENKPVAQDPHHYLNADIKYTTTDQEMAAHDVVNQWKTEHAPADPGVTTELPRPEPDEQIEPEQVISDEELQRMLDEIENDPLYNAQEAAAPAIIQEKELLGLTEKEIMSVQTALGVVAIATLIPLANHYAKHRREEKLIREREDISWGASTFGGVVKNHRNLRRKPTVPAGQSARKYWAS